MGRNSFSHVPLFTGFPGIMPGVFSMLKKTPFFNILHFPAQSSTAMLSNSLWILDSVKSILLHSEFMSSTSICLFFWTQHPGDRKQERVEKQLFDLHLASLRFIWWPLILALERSVKINPPLHGTQGFSAVLASSHSCLFLQRKNSVLCTPSHWSALAQFKISNLFHLKYWSEINKDCNDCIWISSFYLSDVRILFSKPQKQWKAYPRSKSPLLSFTAVILALIRMKLLIFQKTGKNYGHLSIYLCKEISAQGQLLAKY